MSETKVPETTEDGYWRLVFAGGSGSTNITVERNSHGGTNPRVDDSGGALRFYYQNGRRKIFSYSVIRTAEYVPMDLAPL